jgi:anthranilate synthase component 2
MGHQCIGQVFGGKIVRAPTGLMHGKSSLVWHRTDMDTVLSGLPDPFQAARYHSLVISRDGFPEDELEVTAWTEDETVMAVKHKKYPLIQGVQFHPESVIVHLSLLFDTTIVSFMHAFIRDELRVSSIQIFVTQTHSTFRSAPITSRSAPSHRDDVRTHD